MSKTPKMIKVPARAGRKNKEVAKSKRIVEKPAMRRIGFDFPDKLIADFKVAVNMKGKSMTEKITEWMVSYCEEVKKEKGIARLSE